MGARVSTQERALAFSPAMAEMVILERLAGLMEPVPVRDITTWVRETYPQIPLDSWTVHDRLRKAMKRLVDAGLVETAALVAEDGRPVRGRPARGYLVAAHEREAAARLSRA